MTDDRDPETASEARKTHAKRTADESLVVLFGSRYWQGFVDWVPIHQNPEDGSR